MCDVMPVFDRVTRNPGFDVILDLQHQRTGPQRRVGRRVLGVSEYV